MKSLLLIACFLCSIRCLGADAYETLEAGGKVYKDVVVLSANAASLSIRHSKGLAQVSLATLSPELQLKYGYNSESAAMREADLDAQRQQLIREQRERLAAAKATQKARTSAYRVKDAFSRFGSVPTLRQEVDLRERFRQHGIRVRSQAGPSCSVHAILAAMEYQIAERHGRVLNLSEPYLVDATSRSLGRPNIVGYDPETGMARGQDAGFSLSQVFQAIRGYGLALERTREQIALGEPYSLVDTQNFSAFMVPGTDSEKGVENIVHVLNAGMPVIVGVSWPAYSRIQRTSLLSRQPPRSGAGHAVTIVGYRCENAKLESAKFIFRNSWGDQWGAGGYGFFTTEYLLKNLNTAYVLELH